MGCISSKAGMCSIREEVRHASAWEDLITSTGTKDQLFALLFSSSFKSSTHVLQQPKYDVSNNSSNVDGVSDKKLMGSRSFHTVEEYDALLQTIQDDGNYSVESENGWKRKTAGKGLKSLDVPNIEFPALAAFQVSYVTPKFGSYNVCGMQEKEGGGGSTVFSPDLVAAFEHCMQQLQVDEDNILRKMDGCSWVDEIENQVVVSCPQTHNQDD